jgi:surface protein
MRGMFYYCTALRGSIPLFDTRNVTDMNAMFSYCSNLEEIPTFDTQNVGNMREMLAYCAKLIEIPLFDTSRVEDMSFMCSYCSNVLRGMLRLYEQASTQPNVPQHWMCFEHCGESLHEERDLIPQSWGGDGQG